MQCGHSRSGWAHTRIQSLTRRIHEKEKILELAVLSLSDRSLAKPMSQNAGQTKSKKARE